MLVACEEPAVPSVPAKARPSVTRTAGATPRMSVHRGSVETPTRLPTRTPLPSRTPKPTATPLPTRTPDTEPLNVRLSLDSLVATEEARFGAEELEGRVERAYFVKTGDLIDVFASDPGASLVRQGHGAIVGHGREFRWGLEPYDEPRGLAIVEISHLEARIPSGADQSDDSNRVSEATVFGPKRRLHHVVFDADEFPSRIGPWPEAVGWWSDEIGDELVRRAPDLIDESGMATPTPPPTATRHPSITPFPPKPTPDVALSLVGEQPSPLGVGEVPAALLETAREIPWVKGATWRFRHVGVANERVFRSGEVVLQVEEAWRLAPDVMGVRMSIPHSMLHSALGDVLYMLPGGVVSRAEHPGPPFTAADLDEMRGSGLEPGSSGRGCDWTVPSLRLPWLDTLRSGCDMRFRWTGTVHVPAGQFDGCLGRFHRMTAGGGPVVWYCPDVGIVRKVFRGIVGGQAILDVLDLVDYEIPPQVPVP